MQHRICEWAAQMHVADLSAEDLAPSQPEYIIHVANFLSPEECAAMIAASEEVCSIRPVLSPGSCPHMPLILRG
jgi:hypothetical protein